MIEKTCTKCKQVRDAETEFAKNKRNADGLDRHCKFCHNLYYQEHKKEHKHYDRTHTAQRRASKLKTNYGMTQEDYNKMFAEQDGKCAICEIPQEQCKRAFAVDHDHVTGKPRGLLCYNCNHGLADFKDSPASLERAIKYLRERRSYDVTIP